MKVFFNDFKIQIFLSLFLSIYCVVEEGNIYLPMLSNFTLEHSQNKINNKNYYTIPLRVGTPGEEFDVQVDTSSATTWIPSDKCDNCDLANKFYEEENSKTSSPTDIYIRIEDEDGNVEGFQVNDNIRLGMYKLKQYGFVQVTRVEDEFKDHYQGKLGLGYKNHYLKDEEFNFIEKLKKNNLIVKKVFSITTINERRGMLLIGDIPGKRYKSYCNVTTNTDDLDDMYKESWICQISHISAFDLNKGIFNKIKYYEELVNNNLVNFDSAYDYIAVPISEKEHIQKLLDKAELECIEISQNETKPREKYSLRNIIREKEITISCKTNLDDLKKKNLALSFVLQGYAYSLPLDLLFTNGKNDDEMEMLIKYIDDKEAIWTFGYPFMNQFLMVFNMEEDEVGIKKLKKTALPIIKLKDWKATKFLKKSSTTSAFKTIAYIILILVVFAIIFFIYHAIRKRSLESNKVENNENAVF